MFKVISFALLISLISTVFSTQLENKKSFGLDWSRVDIPCTLKCTSYWNCYLKNFKDTSVCSYPEGCDCDRFSKSISSSSSDDSDEFYPDDYQDLNSNEKSTTGEMFLRGKIFKAPYLYKDIKNQFKNLIKGGDDDEDEFLFKLKPAVIREKDRCAYECKNYVKCKSSNPLKSTSCIVPTCDCKNYLVFGNGISKLKKILDHSKLIKQKVENANEDEFIFRDIKKIIKTNKKCVDQCKNFNQCKNDNPSNAESCDIPPESCKCNRRELEIGLGFGNAKIKFDLNKNNNDENEDEFIFDRVLNKIYKNYQKNIKKMDQDEDINEEIIRFNEKAEKLIEKYRNILHSSIIVKKNNNLIEYVEIVLPNSRYAIEFKPNSK